MEIEVMRNPLKTLSLLTLFATAAGPTALATVTLSFVQQNTVIPTIGESAVVEVRADLTEAIIGWGLDLAVVDPSVATLTDLAVALPWDAAEATLDHDLFGATSLTSVGPGTDILLATLTFQAVGDGVTNIALLTSNDEDEGFALANWSGLDSVVFASGTITVPEPTSFLVCTLGGLLLGGMTRSRSPR
jgi:hypothetical protein